MERAQGDTFSATLAQPFSAALVAFIARFFAEGVAETPLVASGALNSIDLRRDDVQGL